MDHAQARKMLAEADASTLEERTSRLAWLERRGSPQDGRILPGGMAAATAFWEAGACYVAGQYLATVLLAQTALEHLLAGMISLFAGQDDSHKLSAQKLFKRALDLQLLSQDEFDLFDRLRRFRNPHAHPRAMDDPDNPIRRMIDTQTPIDDIYRLDAEQAIEALRDLLDRRPFALGPLTPWPDGETESPSAP